MLFPFQRGVPYLNAVHPVIASKAAKGGKAFSLDISGGKRKSHLWDSSYAILFRALMYALMEAPTISDEIPFPE